MWIIFLSVSKPGFVSGQEDVTEAILLFNPTARDVMENQSEQPGVLPSPQLRSKLTPDSQPARIPLVPVASIAGTVLDENGEPIAGVVVQSIVVKASLSGPDYLSARTAHTDDRGHYELLGLRPMTMWCGWPEKLPRLNTSRRIRTRTTTIVACSPSIIRTQTRLLRLGDALAPAAQANADFRQPTEPAFDINGRLSGFTSGLDKNELYREGDRMPLGRAFVNLTSGQFRVTDIPRGSYTLRVQQYQADPPLWFAAEEPLTVTAGPIRDLVVQLSGAVEIPVSVSYEEGAKDEGPVNLMLLPQHSRENARDLSIGKCMQELEKLRRQRTKISPKPEPNAFTNVIPDKYKLQVQATGTGTAMLHPQSWGISMFCMANFQSAAAGGPLHVTVRGDSASVQGQVTFQGQAALGARIYLIPTGERAELNWIWRPGGTLRDAGVPPGDIGSGRGWASRQEGNSVRLGRNDHPAAERTPYRCSKPLHWIKNDRAKDICWC